jgi:hypothetical protein
MTSVWKLKLNARSLWEVQFKQKYCITCSDLEATFFSLFPHTPTAFWRQEADSEVMYLTYMLPGNGYGYAELPQKHEGMLS